MARSISTRANSGFVRAVRYSAGTPARSNRARLLVQLSGRNSRNASMTGISSRASVSDTHRMRAFLGYRGIVDHQHGIAAADELIRLNQQLCLHRPGIPDPGRDEVVQLIVVTSCNPLRHWLNALAIARADQSRHVERAHLSPCFVTQPIQKRLEPTSKLVSPIRRPASHGRPLQKPTTHESQKK